MSERPAHAREVAAGGGAAAGDGGWRRLAGRMLAIHGVRLALSLAPLAFVLVVEGGSLDRALAITLVAIFGGAAFRAGADAVSWATTRYRVTDELVEVRSGLLQRSELSIPRDRVRTVNVTAKPLHRLFGLATVEVGTGRAGQGRLRLDAVPAAEAARLRAELLARARAAAADAAGAAAADAAGAAAADGDAAAGALAGLADAPPVVEQPLARLRWRWLPYHLLSPWTLALPVIVVGAGLQLLDSFGVEGVVRDAATDGLDRVDELPLALAGVLLLAVAIVVGVVAASGVFVESWWAFRLTREPGGTLHVRRGLLTSRSITIEQRRLRGVELAQPLPLRAAGGAALLAIVSGLKGSDDGKSARVDALLPSAPLADAAAVAAEVLREPDAPAQLAELTPHPRAALRRRLLRGAAASAAVVVALALAGPALLDLLTGWAPLAGLAAAPPALLLGRDAYRGLGHRVAGRHLVTRHGTFVRRTFALERDGVIGWTLSRTPFQRRAGLVTLTATTAAGAGGYRVVDVGDEEAVRFAEEAVPGLLAPFLADRRILDGADRRPRVPAPAPAPDDGRSR